MSSDAELDAVMERSRALVEESERLVREAEEQTKVIHAWRADNGLDAAMEKFVQTMSPEARKRFEEEMEKAVQQDRLDLEAELERNRIDVGQPKKALRRERNYL